MMNKTLAPFIHTEKNAPYIYLTIIAALVPACCYSIFYYGIRAMVMILICTLSFMTCDVLRSKVSRRDGNGEYFDISSVVSGLVFAMLLPPDTPVYMALAGVLCGSVVTKQIFGGAGSNIINPAAGARLFVEMVFPSGMCGYAEPREDWFGTLERKEIRRLFCRDGVLITRTESSSWMPVDFGEYWETQPWSKNWSEA